MSVARSALISEPVAAEQAHAPDRRHESCHVSLRCRAAGDWRRYGSAIGSDELMAAFAPTRAANVESSLKRRQSDPPRQLFARG
jgi:hypothetical protein